MCFSAGASFTAGAVLAVIGLETIKKVHKPSQFVFACIPLFFSLQQFTEGIVWLTIGKSGFKGIETAATCVFLTLAQVIWPMAVPLSVLLLEKNRKRKKALQGLLVLGVLIALFNIYGMILFKPISEISGFHIAYTSDFRVPFGQIAVIFYLGATIAPLFISSIKKMHVLGTIMAVSFLVSFIFYTQCLTSVWCFFAAVISFMVYYIVKDAHKKFHLDLAEAAGKLLKNVV